MTADRKGEEQPNLMMQRHEESIKLMLSIMDRQQALMEQIDRHIERIDQRIEKMDQRMEEFRRDAAMTRHL